MSVTTHFAAARPTVSVGLLLGPQPPHLGTDTPLTDITAYVRDGMTMSRGRPNELNRIETGTADVPVDNGDRRFEPEYAAGAYYPNIIPSAGLVIKAVYSATTYYLHTGNVTTWPMTWPGVKRARTSIQSSDGFEYLNQSPFVGTVPFGLVGSMIPTLLDAAYARSSGPYSSLDVGQEVCLGINASTDPQGVATLGLLQDLADSENGLLFVNGLGKVVFQDRDHRIRDTRSLNTQATFGDGSVASGELPYLDPETDFGNDRIYNFVSVSSGLATPTVVPQVDTVSGDQYGYRSFSKSTLLQSDADANTQAARILAFNKDPHLRIPSIKLEPLRNAALWPVVLGLEISDRVVVRRRPYASAGAMIQKTMYVEAIKHEISLDPFKWVTTLNLSLVDPNTYWILGDATFGALGTTTRLR